jgi:hypothetical protein
MLASVIRRNWHALNRDIIALGYRASDMFTTLTFGDMVSIVVGAQPGTSVRHFLDQGWTREAHLLANMQERDAGLLRIGQPYPRPGVEQRQPDPQQKFFRGDAMGWDEFDQKQLERYSEENKNKPVGVTRVRTI